MYFDSHYHSAYQFLTESWSSAESQNHKVLASRRIYFAARDLEYARKYGGCMVLIFLANTIERAVLIIVITLHKSNVRKQSESSPFWNLEPWQCGRNITALSNESYKFPAPCCCPLFLFPCNIIAGSHCTLYYDEPLTTGRGESGYVLRRKCLFPLWVH